MGKRLIMILLIAVAALVPLRLFAAKVDGIYDARAPVADRGEASFAQAVRAALAQVIVKMTGSAQAPRTKAAQSVLAKAQNYMVKFVYVRTDDDGLALDVAFEPRALGDALRERGLAVWGRERPATLVWLILDDAVGRRFAPRDEEWIAQTLASSLRARGLPSIDPLYDLRETELLRSHQSFAPLSTALHENSADYGAQAVLVAAVRAQANGWQGDFSLQLAHQTLAFSGRGATPEAVVSQAVDALSEHLAQHYRSIATQTLPSSGDLTIEGVHDADTYARMMNYLQAMEAVRAVHVIRVEPGRVIVRVRANGGLAAVQQSIGFGRVLTLSDSDPTTYWVTGP